MKTYKEFINENSLWKYYDTRDADRFAALSKGTVKPVFMILETGDPAIEQYVTVFYNSYDSNFIVSSKIDFSGDHTWDFRKKYLTFDYDRHGENTELCFESHDPYEALTLCQLLSAFESNLEYSNLIESIGKEIQRETHMEFKPLTSYIDIVKPLVKTWEEDYEDRVPADILERLGYPRGTVTGRRLGL